MAITISVDSPIKSGEGTSLVSDSFTPLSGDTQILICVTVDDTTEGDITSITDSESATITQIADFTNGNRRTRLYAIANPSLIARTITVNFGSATDAYLDLFTIQGSVIDADPSDVTATSNGNSLSPLTSITPNASAGMIVWLVHQSSNSTYSALGAGQSERGMAAVGGGEKSSCLFTTEIFTAAPGDQTATASKSAPWIGLAVEIKEAGGTTPVTKVITGRFDIVQFVTKTFTGRYDLAGKVTKIITGRYDIAEFITKTITGRYDILLFATKVITGRFDIVVFVTKLVTGRYDIAQFVTKAITGRYNILQFATKTITGRFDIAEFVNKMITGRYDIAIFAKKVITGRYDILAGAVKKLTRRLRDLMRYVPQENSM